MFVIIHSAIIAARNSRDRGAETIVVRVVRDRATSSNSQQFLNSLRFKAVTKGLSSCCFWIRARVRGDVGEYVPKFTKPTKQNTQC